MLPELEVSFLVTKGWGLAPCTLEQGGDGGTEQAREKCFSALSAGLCASSALECGLSTRPPASTFRFLCSIPIPWSTAHCISALPASLPLLPLSIESPFGHFVSLSGFLPVSLGFSAFPLERPMRTGVLCHPLLNSQCPRQYLAHSRYLANICQMNSLCKSFKFFFSLSSFLHTFCPSLCPLLALSVCVKSLESCLTLCDPIALTVAHQVPLSMGFSRKEYWSELPCPPPRDLPDPGIEPRSLMSPALAGS